jgi:hypothetical protein
MARELFKELGTRSVARKIWYFISICNGIGALMGRITPSAAHVLPLLSMCMIAPNVTLADPDGTNEYIYSGYYSREQNDGDLARASRNSHYIRFYPDNRIVRLIIPFPYSTTVDPEDIRKVFDFAAGRTSGSAYISDTFGVMHERIVAHLDSVRVIEGNMYFDCGASVPCRIVFDASGMRIIQKGLVKDHVTSYDLIPDLPQTDQ